MAAKKFGESRPGYGDVALIRNPVSEREWLGEVIHWASTGAPKLRDSTTGEVRYFPPHWVVEVDEGERPMPPEKGPQDELELGRLMADLHPEEEEE